MAEKGPLYDVDAALRDAEKSLERSSLKGDLACFRNDLANTLRELFIELRKDAPATPTYAKASLGLVCLGTSGRVFFPTGVVSDIAAAAIVIGTLGTILYMRSEFIRNNTSQF